MKSIVSSENNRWKNIGRYFGIGISMYAPPSLIMHQTIRAFRVYTHFRNCLNSTKGVAFGLF